MYKKWHWYVYILELYNGYYYTGVTWKPEVRMEQHFARLGSKYTKKYGVQRLVYLEEHEDIEMARTREIQNIMIELSDPINVWVFFKKGQITPYVFFWRSRRITIDKVNLVHQSREGSKTLYHFSVSSDGNFYRLGFDSTDLKWVLEATEEDGIAIS